ncbi:MAG TPA: nitroreductase family protein [Streptosporangiaceae bacterium]|nr:nitroreductase family protein [Streptosporangiaceae bacterium]
MEFKEVIGTRRSIRWFKPWKPVEREKIQVILEAANRSSRAVNADYPRALVVHRSELSDEVFASLRNPTTTVDLDLAPTYIFWFYDSEYLQDARDNLKELVRNKVLTASHGWSEAYVDDVMWAQVFVPMQRNNAAGLTFQAAVETGIAIGNALNAAVDEGLGTCLHAMSGVDKIREAFKVPDTWVPVWLQLVGYPLEEREAGGQRPRRPLAKSFFEGDCTRPFEADPAVTERLRAARLLQEPGPLPYRDTEVRMMSRMFGLPE